MMPIDKGKLYGNFYRGQARRERIHERVICQALDLSPEDDVNITTNTTNNGTGGKGMAWVLASLIAASGLGFGLSAILPPHQPAVPPVPPPAVAPVDSSYTVHFYNKDGQLIDVPQRKTVP